MIHTWFKECCQNCGNLNCNQEVFQTKSGVETVVFCNNYPFCKDFAQDEGERIRRPIAYLQDNLCGK